MSKKTLIQYFLFFIYIIFTTYCCYGSERNNIKLLIISLITFVLFTSVRVISKKIYIFFLILLAIEIILYYPFTKFFNTLQEHHLVALIYTDLAETKSYLKTFDFVTIISVLGLVIPLFYFKNLPSVTLSKKQSYFAFFLCVIIIPVLSNIYSILYKYNHQLKVNEIHRNVFIRPFRLFINLSEKSYLLHQNIKFQNHVKSVSPNWTILDAEKDKDIYVFIIGESVRKDFMQIYNPTLKNTPFLDTVPKLKFNAVTAYAGNTIESLSNAFIENKGYLFFPNNVVTLAQKSGYTVDWISNQGSLGKHDSQIASIAKLANSIKFITKGVYTTHKDDQDLLPLFDEALNDSNTPKIIFLHTIGSHPSPCDITKGKYDTKYKSEDISCYIQSIKDTDAFIAEIYKSLIKSNKTFKIVYFSDHGLTIRKNVSLIKNNTFSESNSLHHDEYFKENYDIPLIILDNEYKSTSQINARRNLKDFLLLYSELLKIKTKEIKSPFTFISDDIQTNADSLYNNKYYPNLKNNIYEF